MENNSLSLSALLDQLAGLAVFEFTLLGDYIWKSPNLIDHENEVEMQKLPVYYPDNPEAASYRWAYESLKLNAVFPYLIAVGNLFTAVSLFEFYMLQFVHALAGHSGNPINSVKGQGVKRCFYYLRELELAPETLALYEQVQATLKIRNCLMHASGILSWSRENEEVRRICTTGSYLRPEDRHREGKGRKSDGDLTIVKSAFGDRLQVTNMYSFIASSYLRDYFRAMCAAAKDKLCK
jgi:hypothetical protein